MVKPAFSPGGLKLPSLPVYHQIARRLHARIYHGIYKPGEAIPSEHELGEEFGVSRLTIRQAIRELTDQGTVVSRRGSGTYVVDEPRTVPPVNFIGYLDDLILHGSTMRMTMEGRSIGRPPTAVAEALSLEAGNQVLIVDRVGRNHDLPINFVRVYLPISMADLIEPDQYEEGSLMSLLIERGVDITHAHQTLSATSVTSPISDLLELPDQAPVVYSTITVMSEFEPVYVSEVYYRPDRTTFTSSLAAIPNAQVSSKPREKARSR